MKKQIRFYEKKLKYETDAWDLFTALSAKKRVMVVDVRSSQAFKAEHIPAAINIPHRDMSRKTTAHLDKSLKYVVYCDGIGCNASTKGALKLVRLGFSVKELLGGIEWWRRDGYATEGENAAAGKSLSCGC